MNKMKIFMIFKMIKYKNNNQKYNNTLSQLNQI